jgi:hypothetical protein
MSRPSLADELFSAFDDDHQTELYSTINVPSYTHGSQTLSLAEEFGLDLFDGDGGDGDGDGDDDRVRAHGCLSGDDGDPNGT